MANSKQVEGVCQSTCWRSGVGVPDPGRWTCASSVVSWRPGRIARQSVAWHTGLSRNQVCRSHLGAPSGTSATRKSSITSTEASVVVAPPDGGRTARERRTRDAARSEPTSPGGSAPVAQAVLISENAESRPGQRPVASEGSRTPAASPTRLHRQVKRGSGWCSSRTGT